MYSIRHGWVEQARQLRSPNFNERPAGTVVDLLVVHGISLPPGEFGGPWIDQLFLNQLDVDAHPYFVEIASLQVSSHFLIRRGGELVQYVDCNQRAWHAGRSSWQGRDECNDFAIGIELEGTDHVPYTDSQYTVLNQLAATLVEAYPAISNRIVGHEHIAPGRKTDPGPAFDWSRMTTSLLAQGDAE